MSPSVSRRPLLRAAVVALSASALVLLAGCTADTPAASASPSCGGHVKEILLGDDSATRQVAFDAGDSPKVFNVPASPAPTCAYRSSTSTHGNAPSTITHRTYLYIGISSADAQKLIAAVAATGATKGFTASYTNTPAPSATPVPYALQTRTWSYTSPEPGGSDRGSIGYAYNAPLNPGIVKQVGLEGTPNVLRIETELIRRAD
ncbi:hypothetical protein GCM10009840_22190 [Pseudolysinimonas kribbensis]|uniref:Uncharacterized protein n=1 Tax=Pseudolysinimonas kribbensis TaxID=433641 RepID=A0ABQ6KCA2_9MICO|nr:hypothetical protein [Pseudolysinimonas kribbensis]GMA97055.1 hypothetical protein GCM10025881_38790 [Pseudolysinimonas kribbensis]